MICLTLRTRHWWLQFCWKYFYFDFRIRRSCVSCILHTLREPFICNKIETGTLGLLKSLLKIHGAQFVLLLENTQRWFTPVETAWHQQIWFLPFLSPEQIVQYSARGCGLPFGPTILCSEEQDRDYFICIYFFLGGDQTMQIYGGFDGFPLSIMTLQDISRSLRLKVEGHNGFHGCWISWVTAWNILYIYIPWAHQTYMFRGFHGKYSNLVCKWPKPLFFMVI